MLRYFLNKSSCLKEGKNIEFIFQKYYMISQGTNLDLHLSWILNCVPLLMIRISVAYHTKATWFKTERLIVFLKTSTALTFPPKFLTDNITTEIV